MRTRWIFSFAAVLLIVLSGTDAFAQSKQTQFTTTEQILTPPSLANTVQLYNPLSGFTASFMQLPAQYSSTYQLAALTPSLGSGALAGTPVDEFANISWHSLEPNEGTYNFSVIDNVLQPCSSTNSSSTCLPPGARFAFRIQPLDSSTVASTNITTGVDGYPVYSDLPSYMQTNSHGWLLPVNPTDKTQGHYFIPDWNDPFYIQRAQALLAALGQKYNGDPRIGWVDVGIYGTWGEWHTAGMLIQPGYTFGNIPYSSNQAYYNLNTQAYLQNTGKAGAYQPGTTATKDAIVDAYIKAFPNTQILMMTDDGDGLCHALSANTTIPIGMERDSLGSGPQSWSLQFPNALPDCSTEADQNLILNRWQIAPFVGQPFGNGPNSCTTFTTDPSTGYAYLDEEDQEFHLASIENISLCYPTPWTGLSSMQQQEYLWAGVNSGYRLAPVEVDIPPSTTTSSSTTYSIVTHWANTGIAPTYNLWNVEFSLWSGSPLKEVVAFNSTVDLRKILPTGATPTLFTDTFTITNNNAVAAGLTGGAYELRMRVIDPKGYMNPMQLGLQGEQTGGYYPIGAIVLPSLGQTPAPGSK